MNIHTALDKAGYDGPREHAGAEIRLLCPFHDDTNPSLDINDASGLFYCRSCHKGGTAIELIAEIGALSLFKAGLLLARSGPGEVRSRRVRHPEQDRERAFAFYNHLPHVNWEREKTYTYLFERDFTPAILHQQGVKLNRSSTHPYVLPITEQGVFQGYVARCADNRKGKYLYNPGMVKKSCLDGDLTPGDVLVVEGKLTQAKVIQYGWKNTAAILGSDFSDEQAAKLAKVAKRVINGCDPDPAGRLAGEQIHQKMQRYAIPVVDYPFGDFSDDFCEMSKQQFLSGFLSLSQGDEHHGIDSAKQFRWSTRVCIRAFSSRTGSKGRSRCSPC